MSYTRTSAVLLVVAIVIGITVAVHAEGTDPSTGSGQEPTGVFFEATRLTADLEGTGVGQIKPFGAEFCAEGVRAVESNAAVTAHTEPFSTTTRVWVEHNSAVTFTVSFKNSDGYGLGQCEIGPAGGRAWDYCEHDPVGDYIANRAIVHAPQDTVVSGIAVAQPEQWEPPPPQDHKIYLPFVRRES